MLNGFEHLLTTKGPPDALCNGRAKHVDRMKLFGSASDNVPPPTVSQRSGTNAHQSSNHHMQRQQTHHHHHHHQYAPQQGRPSQPMPHFSPEQALNLPSGQFQQGQYFPPQIPRGQQFPFRGKQNKFRGNRKRKRGGNQRPQNQYPRTHHADSETLVYGPGLADVLERHRQELAHVKQQRRLEMSDVHDRSRTASVGQRFEENYKRQDAQRQQQFARNRNKKRKQRARQKKGKKQNVLNMLVRKNPQYPSDHPQQQQPHNRQRGGGGGRGRNFRGRGRGRGGHRRRTSNPLTSNRRQQRSHHQPGHTQTDRDGDSVMGESRPQAQSPTRNKQSVLFGADRSLVRSMSPFRHTVVSQSSAGARARNHAARGSPPRSSSSSSPTSSARTSVTGPRLLNPNAGSETPIYDPEDQKSYKQLARLFASRPADYVDKYCDRQQDLKRKQERTIIENHYRFAADSVHAKLDEARKTRPSLPVDDFLSEFKLRRRSMTDDEDEGDDDEPLQLSAAFATPFVAEPSSSSAQQTQSRDNGAYSYSSVERKAPTTHEHSDSSSSSTARGTGGVSSWLTSSSLSSSSSSSSRRASLPTPSSVPRVDIPASPLAPPALTSSSSSSSSMEPSSPSSAPLLAQEEPSTERPPSPLNLPTRSPKAAAASRIGLFGRSNGPKCGWINQQSTDFSLMYQQYQ